MIVVAGEALVDLVIDAGGAVVATLGGGPYNVARTIGRLQHPVSFLGAISQDHLGSRLVAQLAADGVSADTVVRTTLPTTLAVAELDDQGAAKYHFYATDTSAPSLARIPATASAPAAVHVGTLGLTLEPMASTLTAYLRELPASTLVMVDPNCRASVITDRSAYLRCVAEAYGRADVVKVSNEDVAYLTRAVDAVEYARSLIARGVRLVLLTTGAGGTWAITNDGEVLVPTVRIEVADTIGAGDSFGGAFLTWWLEAGCTREQLSDVAHVAIAVDAAQEVAAITCQRVGAEPPWRSELSERWQQAPTC